MGGLVLSIFKMFWVHKGPAQVKGPDSTVLHRDHGPGGGGYLELVVYHLAVLLPGG